MKPLNDEEDAPSAMEMESATSTEEVDIDLDGVTSIKALRVHTTSEDRCGSKETRRFHMELTYPFTIT